MKRKIRFKSGTTAIAVPDRGMLSEITARRAETVSVGLPCAGFPGIHESGAVVSFGFNTVRVGSVQPRNFRQRDSGLCAVKPVLPSLGGASSSLREVEGAFCAEGGEKLCHLVRADSGRRVGSSGTRMA